MEDGLREARQVRAAESQSLFRGINERINALNEAFSMVLPRGEWVCECADAVCVQPIEMTGADYEAIRAHPNHFAVVPGHELAEVDGVLEDHDHYLVVEKIGAGAAVARSNDPRHALEVAGAAR
jgi:hypothetical protein